MEKKKQIMFEHEAYGITWLLTPYIKKYVKNNRLALLLIDAKDGIPFCKASVNLPDQSIGEKELFIKNYSENEGILESLVKAEIVSKSKKRIQVGFVYVDVVDLLIEF